MKILVIGDSCTDIFVYGKIERICPEAPVPVFTPVSHTQNGGMAANVAENLMSLGASVDLITNLEVITKTRYVDLKSNQMIVRVDENDTVSNSFSATTIDFSKYDAVVVSDYCKGFLTPSDLLRISVSHPLTFLDTKKILNDKMNGFSFIKINEWEWNKTKDSISSISNWTNKLIITLSEKGCMYKGREYPPSDTIDVKDIAGAGDTFIAALAFKFVETQDISQAITFANECAGKVVKKKGVSVI